VLTLLESRLVLDELGAADGSWAFAPAAEKGRTATSFLIADRTQGAVVVANNPINNIDPDGQNLLAAAAAAAGGLAYFGQRRNDLSAASFSDQVLQDAIDRNNRTIASLQRIIDDPENNTFQSQGLGVGGTMGASSGSNCDEEQQLRDTFESLTNIRGWHSGAGELGARLSNRGFTGLPTEFQQSAGERQALARSLLARGQAYGRFLQRAYRNAFFF